MNINNSNNRLGFGVSWQQAREELQKLPEDHALFSQYNYTLDGKTHARKEVFLKRLDAFSEQAQGFKLNWNVSKTKLKDFFAHPLNSFLQLYKNHNATGKNLYHTKGKQYPFKRQILEPVTDYRGGSVLTTFENDNTAVVANKLLDNRELLTSVFKEAKLPEPKNIQF